MKTETTLHPVLVRLIKNSPNFRRGWQMAAATADEETTAQARGWKDVSWGRLYWVAFMRRWVSIPGRD